MNKFFHVSQFVECLFDETETAHKATKIIEGMLKVSSPRLSDITREMRGNESANYKHIQRFLKEVDPRENLLRLFQNQGRAIPCHFVSYSSKAVNAEAKSRNQRHFEAFEKMKELLGNKPLEIKTQAQHLYVLCISMNISSINYNNVHIGERCLI